MAYLRERDGDVCQLCGLPVVDEPFPHPLSPTFDHIMPLSQGGLHERSNLQLAHFSCNSSKGAYVAATLLLDTPQGIPPALVAKKPQVALCP
jgi:5-methylcytosine-specific restriction endonuclease McrA